MSGSTIGGIVGGVIGFYVGGPTGAQWGWMIGSAVGGYVDPTVIKGPQLTDPQQQTASEGAPIPLVYGTYAVIGTIIQCQSVPTEHKHEDSGKGGPVQETYTYTRTVAIAICRAAPLGGEMMLRRAWVNGKLAYDATGSGKLDADSAAFLDGMTFYSGSETQMPDANLEALPTEDGGGVGNVPAYRGLCYAVLPSCDVTQSGGAVPIIKWEVVSSGTQTTTCDEIETGLVAWYPLDDAVRNGTAREVVAGRDGQYSDTAGVNVGPAISPNGTPSFRMTSIYDFMRAVYNDVFGTYYYPDGWTAQIWFQLDSAADEDGGTNMRNIVTYWDDVISGDGDWGIQLDGDHNLVPQAALDESGIIAGSGAYGSAPHLLTATFDPDGQAKFYIDNILVGEEAAVASTHASSSLIIGGGEFPESAGIVGCASDLKIWSFPRTAEQIAQDCLYGYYPAPDGAGTYVGRNGLVFTQCATTVTPDTLTLDMVVGDLTARGTVNDYDVSALEGIPVLGLGITQPTTSGACLQELQQVYFFDYPEWGNSGDDYVKLRAVRRGGASVCNLTDDDLVDVDADEDVRRQSVEFPRKLNFIAPDPEHDYEPITQSSERESENVKSESEVTVSTAVAGNRDFAAPIADKLLRIACEEAQGQITRTVPEEFTQFTTSDIVTYGGRRYRIDKIDAQDGQSQWTLTRDRASAYESNATGSVGVAVPDPVSSLRGPTMFWAGNLPRLNSGDVGPGLYIGVCGLLSAWQGCDLYLSIDGGTTESKVATIIDPATMGWLTADMTASGEPLSVNLYNDDTLDDATDDQLALRFNACAVTSAGVSEIMQFKNATDTGVRTYDLSTLTRAGLGTVDADHATDDPFVVLDNSILFLPLDISLAGKDLIFRPVTRGTTPANNQTYTVRFSPKFFGAQVIETITVGGAAITVNGDNLVRTVPDA